METIFDLELFAIELRYIALETADRAVRTVLLALADAIDRNMGRAVG